VGLGPHHPISLGPLYKLWGIDWEEGIHLPSRLGGFGGGERRTSPGGVRVRARAEITFIEVICWHVFHRIFCQSSTAIQTIMSEGKITRSHGFFTRDLVSRGLNAKLIFALFFQ